MLTEKIPVDQESKKQFRYALFIDALRQDVQAIILYMRSHITEEGWCQFALSESPLYDKNPDHIGLDFVWVDVSKEQSELQWATEDGLMSEFPRIGGSTLDIEEGAEGKDLHVEYFPYSA